MSNWCEMHNHIKNACPWCEISELEQSLESVQRERDTYREIGTRRLNQFSTVKYEHDLLGQQVESLQQDKEALIEVLEWYGDESHYMQPDSPYEMSSVDEDGGEKARTILSRMKGETT